MTLLAAAHISWHPAAHKSTASAVAESAKRAHGSQRSTVAFSKAHTARLTRCSAPILELQYTQVFSFSRHKSAFSGLNAAPGAAARLTALHVARGQAAAVAAAAQAAAAEQLHGLLWDTLQQQMQASA